MMNCCRPVAGDCGTRCGCDRRLPVWFWLVQVWLLLPWWLSLAGMVSHVDLTGLFYPTSSLLVVALFCGLPVFLMLFVVYVQKMPLALAQLIFILLWSGALGELIMMMLALLACAPSQEEWFGGLICVHLMIMLMLTFSPRLWQHFFRGTSYQRAIEK